LPSYTEGFPTAIAEALAAGLPIVTTRIRGMADHLADEDNALFVVVRDVTSLTLALERILADEELRHRMGDANLTKISQFAPLPVAQQYLEALTRIQSASRSSAPRAGSATARV
jgi:glycosyltransferase involved in cell wall biosynthesis